MIASIARGVRSTAALYVVAVCACILPGLPGDAAAQLALPALNGPADADAPTTLGTPAKPGTPANPGPPATPGTPGVLGTPTPSEILGTATASPLGWRIVKEAPIRPARLANHTERTGSTGFLDQQLRFPRVREAFEDKGTEVASRFREKGVESPAEVYIRVFKKEKLLELWAREQGERAFSLVSSYPVCKLSGRLGPKRREGDGQIPEGFYSIDMFNPWSEYHLSMRLDYPNAVDQARGRTARLGGDIFIHGGCATVGCVPMTDEAIEELYLIAVAARDAGQRRIPVHIFPTRLDARGMRWLAHAYGSDFVDFPFWQNLQEGYLAFERTRTLPSIGTYRGQYVVVPDMPAPGAALTTALR